MKVKFTGCKHLDFDVEYTAKKKLIYLGETKVFWLRKSYDPSLPTMVQFCKLRGRLNSPGACLNERNARCSEYEDFEHEVEIEDGQEDD